MTDVDLLIRQIDFVRRCLARTYKNFPDCDPRLRSTLMCVLQSIRTTHPIMKRIYAERRKQI